MMWPMNEIDTPKNGSLDDPPPMGKRLSPPERAIWWMARGKRITPKEFKRHHWWARRAFKTRELSLMWTLTGLDERPEEDNAFCWFPDLKGASKSPKAFLKACRSNNLLKFRGFGKVSLARMIEAMGYKREKIRCDLCGALAGVDKDHPAYKITKKKKEKNEEGKKQAPGKFGEE